MNIIDAINTLPADVGFGNRALYNMCSDPNTNIDDPSHLSGLIWIIGRAYAASPERRTYGFAKDANGKVIKTDGKKKALWKATNAADGRGGYFSSIANYIVSDPDFADLTGDISYLRSRSYAYDGGENDIELLARSIHAVGLYNQLIRHASEVFDGLHDPDSDEAANAIARGARCKNQISFCSKFLHFHSPANVFIIDQYSLDGGKRLIPATSRTAMPNFKDGSGALTPLTRPGLKDNYKDIMRRLGNMAPLFAGADADDISDYEEKLHNYVEHCARSYCIARYLHANGVNVTPRRIDDLLLCIKK